MRRPLIALVGIFASAQAGSAAPAVENRCGWLVNETPGNFELVDRAGHWLIAAQGGYQARGLDDMPDMSTAGWVETNGPHGYGCACIRAVTDSAAMKVRRLVSATPIPLARCRSDRKLPKP